MAAEDEVLRAVELSGWRYEIRRGDAPHNLRVLLEVGRTENGSFVWHPFYSLFQRGKPVWHETELMEDLAELREAERVRGIAASRAKWNQR